MQLNYICICLYAVASRCQEVSGTNAGGGRGGLHSSLKKGVTPKIRMLCFVLINSVILNLHCVWILILSRK